MSKKLREYQATRAKHRAAINAIYGAASAVDRAVTAEEQTEIDSLTARIATLDGAIASEEASLRTVASSVTEVLEEAAALRISGGAPRLEQDPKRGFRTFGDFAQAVRVGSQPGNRIDDRLQIAAAAPTTFGSEIGGPDGGFAIPPDFANEIWIQSLSEDSLIPLTENTETSSNSMVFPKDETTPWGTDGIRAYWQAEATVATQTKPKLSQSLLRLYKLMALIPLTDELLSDTNALNSYVPSKVADSIRFKVNEAILFGAGNGTPGGAFTSNAVVVVAKEAAQPTLTIQPANLFKMIARLPPGSFPRAVWLVGPDALPALFGLTLGNYPIYLPATAAVGGIQLNPYGTLLGRPIMVSQHPAAFSAQGDILLGDFKYYRTLTKAGGMQTATSMHLYFDADATAFRTTFRIDGGPKIVNPIAQAKGAATLSPFVTLQAR